MRPNETTSFRQNFNNKNGNSMTSKKRIKKRISKLLELNSGSINTYNSGSVGSRTRNDSDQEKCKVLITCSTMETTT